MGWRTKRGGAASNARSDGHVGARRSGAFRSRPGPLSPALATLNPARRSLARRALLSVSAAICLTASVPSLATAAETCPNEQLRGESNVNPATGQPYSVQLPDCRAYELVSPANAGGWEAPAAPHLIAGQDSEVLVSPAGSIFYESQTQAPETGALENGNYLRVFRSHRTPAGWVTRSLVSTSTLGNVLLADVASTGSRALVQTTIGLSPEDIDNPTNGTAEGGLDLYVVEEGQPPRLVTHGPVPSPTEPTAGTGLANFDLTAVAFESKTSLALPNSPGESTAGCYLWADDGDRFAATASPPADPCTEFAVSAGGRAIVRAGPETGESDLFASYFAKTENDLLGTIELAGPEAHFTAMSPDGETVYLTTDEHLVPDSGGADAGNDIYAVNLRRAIPGSGLPKPPAITCVSCEAGGSPNSAAAQYVGQSGDGSHVFFTVAGALYTYSAQGVKQIASAADAVESPVFSNDGRYTVASTAEAIAPNDADGSPDLYLFSEGAAPQLITIPESSAEYHARAVSDAGNRILYEADTNGASLIDEWSSGEQTQISPIGTKNDVVLGATGPELEDIFFRLNQALIPADRNGGTTDIYDARVGGGFPAARESASLSQTPNPVAPDPPSYSPNLSVSSIAPPGLLPDTATLRATAPRKPLTRAQKLTAALKKCRQSKKKAGRKRCERGARGRFEIRHATAKRDSSGGR